MMDQAIVEALADAFRRAPACPLHAPMAPYARTFDVCPDCRRHLVEAYEAVRRILLGEPSAKPPLGLIQASAIDAPRLESGLVDSMSIGYVPEKGRP